MNQKKRQVGKKLATLVPSNFAPFNNPIQMLLAQREEHYDLRNYTERSSLIRLSRGGGDIIFSKYCSLPFFKNNNAEEGNTRLKTKGRFASNKPSNNWSKIDSDNDNDTTSHI